MARFARLLVGKKSRKIEILGGDYHCQPGCIEIRAIDYDRPVLLGLPTEIELHLNLQEARAVRAAIGRAIMAEEGCE